MGKIKGWTKITKNSWKNDTNSDVISYRYVSAPIPYRIILSKTTKENRIESSGIVKYSRNIDESKEIDSTGNLEGAKRIILWYMRSHPNG